MYVQTARESYHYVHSAGGRKGVFEEGRECLRKEGSVQGVECQEQYLGSMRIDEINLTSTHKQPLKRGAGKITLSQDRTIIFTNT